MATRHGNGIVGPIRLTAASSRRSLVAAGAGLMLGAAGLLLPAAMDVAEARKGKNKGKGGNKGQGGGEKGKNTKKKQARVRAASFMGVNITFINGTSSGEVSISRDGTQTDRGVAPGEQVTLSVAGSAQHPVGTITAGDQSYVVYAQNPMIGLPWVKILDRASDGLIFNEDLEEGEQVASDLFRLQRNADSAENKEFVLTLLRAPGGAGSANASTASSGRTGDGGKRGKGSKGKKGDKGGKGKKGDKKRGGQNKAGGNGNQDEGAEVRAQSRDVSLTLVNKSLETMRVQSFIGEGGATAGRVTTLDPGESMSVAADDVSFTVERSSGDVVTIEATNPWIGQPRVRISDNQGKEQTVSLSEGETVNIMVGNGGYAVSRDDDDDSYKNLTVAVLQ